jgi:hypothetical protein
MARDLRNTRAAPLRVRRKCRRARDRDSLGAPVFFRQRVRDHRRKILARAA